MSRARGYTVVELLVASAILLTVLLSVASVLRSGLSGVPLLEEATDLHQRARVAADALTADLRAAASGIDAPLSDAFAAVVPRWPHEGPAAAAPDVVTVRYVSAHGAHARLLEELAPGAAAATLDTSAPDCARGTAACGFTAGMRAVLFTTDGVWNLVSIDGAGAGVLTLGDAGAPRAVTYPAGTPVTEAVEVTWSRDAAALTLRRTENGSGFPLADHNVHAAFEYFDAGLSPLPLSVLTDGPFRGAGGTAFDADLLRIRHVRAVLRFETALDRLRGPDARFFARPGTAGRGSPVLPDVVITVESSLRSKGR